MTDSQTAINSTVRTYFCQPGYYNDMATLFFNPQEVAIKQLFHQEGQPPMALACSLPYNSLTLSSFSRHQTALSPGRSTLAGISMQFTVQFLHPVPLRLLLFLFFFMPSNSSFTRKFSPRGISVQFTVQFPHLVCFSRHQTALTKKVDPRCH